VTWYLVAPAAKVSGGNREALRFGEELAARGGDVSVLWMWKAAHPISSTLHDTHLSAWRPRLSRAIAEFPLLLFRFIRRVRCAGAAELSRGARFVFTHYVTLPLSLAVPPGNRYFLVQDLEWKFVGNPWIAYVLRHTILYCYRRGVLISANPFLTAALRDMRLEVPFELPIWADERFAIESSGPRDIDISMVLRKGAHKRLDLYLSFVQLAQERNLKLAVISPDEEIIAAARGSSNLCLLRPSLTEMRALYARSKCFLHLSDHEGFGLPPLEAMGAGCVPICRDSGGVRAFMCVEGLQPLLLPLTVGIGEILHIAEAILNDVPRLAELSRIARDVFDRGIAGTKAARDSCLERLPATASLKEVAT
jgi:glycosyltransferase involved in cell wall biosynthesis